MEASATGRILSVGVEPSAFGTRGEREAGDGLSIEAVPTAAAGLDYLDETAVACVVSAYELPDMTGVAFLEAVRENHHDLPFVLYTDAGSEAIAGQAINAGVTNYLPAASTTPAELAETVEQAVETYHEQRARRQSERRYQAILEDPNLLVGVLSADGRLVEANQTAAAYAAASVDEMVGDAFWETEWWDDETATLIKEKVQTAATGEYVEYETELTDADGEAYAVRGSVRPVTDAAGTVVALIVSALDITERKLKSRQLREQQQFVQGILDALPDAFYAFDTDGYLLQWNDQLEAVTGYSAAAIEEMHVTDFVPADEVAPIAEHFETVVTERQQVTIESSFETKAGEVIPHEFTGGPLKSPTGAVRGVVGIGRDISDQRKRERRLRAIFNNTYQFTGLMRPDGTLIEANETALSFGGLDRDDVVGEKIWDVYWFQADDTARETAIEAVEQARDGVLFREQLAVQGQNRDAIIDFSVRPVTDNSGEVTLLIPEGRDITRLTEREQQLTLTNRVLRHNIRNRLTLIRGTAESLLSADGDDQTTTAQSIIDAADDLLSTAEMTRQVNELIETDPDPAPIDLVGPVTAATTALQSRYPTATITADLPETAPATTITAIETAVKELVENAIIHDETDTPQVHVAVRAQPETIEIVVSDTAGGLPATEQEILTGDASVDAVNHGQGLGLWHVYWTVHYSGGQITVPENGPDGTEIRITLPRGTQQDGAGGI